MKSALIKALRWWLPALLITALGLYALHLTSPDGAGPGLTGERAAQPVAVETAPLTRGPLEDVRRFTGSLEAANQFDLAARTGGRLRQLRVDIGDTVEHGELIARLDSEEQEQAVAEALAARDVARAQLAETRAALASARKELDRTRALRERQVASQAELEAAEARVAAEQSREQLARAQIAQREAALAAARVRLSWTEIRADWEGGGETRVVGERYRDEGAALNAGDPVVSLMDTRTLRAVGFVTERDYAHLNPGQAARLRVDTHPGEDFPATVHRLAPRFSPGSRQARLELTVPNPEGRLQPGLFARLHITVGETRDALWVPRDALVRRGDEVGIFLVDEDVGDDQPPRARYHTVTTGVRDGDRVQILSPALQGDVVTLGQHLIRDGSPLRPERLTDALARQDEEQEG
ncbi:efflux RND transporter periplasmic adaptor subunit [Alkalilimnicola ehrlichii]|uniref:efflux RND transporter periplasmic adaptor subunit n=1 Tax=Alkalilimnicola ehrlichii TaxID=351052 RepID=UPI003BA10DF3